MPSLLLAAVAVLELIDPDGLISADLAVVAFGLSFSAITYGLTFGSVRVDGTGVYYRDWSYLRPRHMSREAVSEISVAPIPGVGPARAAIVLVPQTGKPVPLTLLAAYTTAGGRAWLESTRQAMTDALQRS